ncbi:MAG TPA: LysM peptidoglycan-binding domain-containing protein [Dehalococcoidia bacterium]|nr:LysM peptidoglycan-binding domain-containing protein [Dehalococcoidia bacterium]
MEKAKLKNLDTNEEIPCLFNPNEYTFSKRNTWTSKMVKGQNVPSLEFSGGDSITLKMQLFFDTYATGGDVRTTTNKIWKLMNINPDLTDMNSNQGRPPMVEFQWGATWSFNAVITSISQKFTLFRDNGIPVRATLDVDFLQAKEEGKYPGQNPTTVGNPGYKQRTIREGDTIDWIAFEEYGDSAMWRFIADNNNLDNPMKLKPGQMLAIVPIP